MTRFLLVCLGGALGSGARYLIALGAPHPTLIVKLAGSFVMELMQGKLSSLHIAVAAVHGIVFLATWRNCKHIANAVTLPTVYEVCRASGYEHHSSTPYELLRESYEEL